MGMGGSCPGIVGILGAEAGVAAPGRYWQDDAEALSDSGLGARQRRPSLAVQTLVIPLWERVDRLEGVVERRDGVGKRALLVDDPPPAVARSERYTPPATCTVKAL